MRQAYKPEVRVIKFGGCNTTKEGNKSSCEAGPLDHWLGRTAYSPQSDKKEMRWYEGGTEKKEKGAAKNTGEECLPECGVSRGRPGTREGANQRIFTNWGGIFEAIAWDFGA